VGRGERLKGCVAALGVLVLSFVCWVGAGRKKRGESGLRVSPYLLPVSHTECCTLDWNRILYHLSSRTSKRDQQAPSRTLQNQFDQDYRLDPRRV